MALPSSGEISLGDLQGEFGGTNPISIIEYYRGGGLVPNILANTNIPQTGPLALSYFYNGTANFTFYTNLGTGFNGPLYNVTTQPDGKILVGGNFGTLNGNTRNRLVRLNSDGTEDTSFYTNLGGGFNNIVHSIEIQSDDKILVGGFFDNFNGNTRNRLVRLNSNGTEDTSFYTNLGTGFNNSVYNVTIQPDGKILVGGSFTALNGSTRNKLVRLNSNGTEDTSFYSNLGTGFEGVELIPSNIRSVYVQPDGKILVGGFFVSLNGNTRTNLVRLNSNGTEDTN